MSWRCRKRSDDGLVCMMGPNHSGDHQAVVLLRGHVALVWWENQDSGAAVAQDAGPAPSPVEAAPDPISEPAGPAESAVMYPPKDRYFGKDIVGRRQTRETSHNLYAGTGDGVHTSWNLFGHEILPLPTLDELEAA